MVLTWLRGASCLLAAVLVFPFPSSAFDTPLSDTAVREAYFMGQRHDETLHSVLRQIHQTSAVPQRPAPIISSVAFFTPYALVAELSSQRLTGTARNRRRSIIGNGGDRQDHCADRIDGLLRGTQLLAQPNGSRSGTPIGYTYSGLTDFWQGFRCAESSIRKILLNAFSNSAEPNYICSEMVAAHSRSYR